MFPQSINKNLRDHRVLQNQMMKKLLHLLKLDSKDRHQSDRFRDLTLVAVATEIERSSIREVAVQVVEK
jgi:hypothetical protein